MKPKKSPRADLNGKRGIFFQIGLSASLLLMIVFFSSSQPAVSVPEIDILPGMEAFDLPPVTIEQPEKTEPKRIEIRQADIIKIVVNSKKIESAGFEFPEDWTKDFVFVPVESKSETEMDDSAIIDSFAAEEQPLFRGQDAGAFRAWVMQNVNYPAIALENGIQGRVTLQFVIDKNGDLTDIKVLSSPDRSLADEAVRLLKSSEQWTPGKQRGRPVGVRFTIPVDFRIQ